MRRSFAAGCAILILLGLLHLFGHHSMVTGSGDSEGERRMLELMRVPQDMGAGFVRSTMDIVAGFSLGLSVFSVGLGVLGLVILRQGASPELLRAVATVYAGIFGVMTGVGLRYWFLAPLLLLASAFSCFIATLLLSAFRRAQEG
jgi:hypothetical protein